MINQLVKEVDVSVADVTELRVFHLSNADPVELADMLAGLFPDDTKTDNQNQQFAFRGGIGRGPFGGPFGAGVARGPALRATASPRLFAALRDRYGFRGDEDASDLGGSSNLNLLLTDGRHRRRHQCQPLQRLC